MIGPGLGQESKFVDAVVGFGDTLPIDTSKDSNIENLMASVEAAQGERSRLLAEQKRMLKRACELSLKVLGEDTTNWEVSVIDVLNTVAPPFVIELVCINPQEVDYLRTQIVQDVARKISHGRVTASQPAGGSPTETGKMKWSIQVSISSY